MASTAQTLLNSAIAAGYDALSSRDLKECLLYAVQSGGGGTVGSITFGNYSGGTPNFTPSSGGGLAVDTSNGRPWYYYNSIWH